MSQRVVRVRPRTLETIGRLLEEHYRTLTVEELPPRLRAIVRRLDEETISRIVSEGTDHSFGSSSQADASQRPAAAVMNEKENGAG